MDNGSYAVVLTGRMRESRSKLVASLKARGIVVHDRVTANTDLVIAAQLGRRTTKEIDALQLGIPLVLEAIAFDLIYSRTTMQKVLQENDVTTGRMSVQQALDGSSKTRSRRAPRRNAATKARAIDAAINKQIADSIDRMGSSPAALACGF